MSNKIEVTFVTGDGDEIVVETAVGISLMEAAKAVGVPGIDAVCGGSCACSTCHVEVDERWFHQVGVPSEMEAMTLYMGLPRRQRSRLACQVILNRGLDGLRVQVVS